MYTSSPARSGHSYSGASPRYGGNRAAQSAHIPVDETPIVNFYSTIEKTPSNDWQRRTSALNVLVDQIPGDEGYILEHAWYNNPPTLRHLSNPLSDLLKDPRSTVVKRTCESLLVLFSRCRAEARYLFKDLMPTVLSVHAQTVQVIRQAVQYLIMETIPNVPCKMVMPLWMERLKVDKSRTVRDACALYLGQALQSWVDPGYLTDEIWMQVGKVLVGSLRDPSPHVRSYSKSALEHMHQAQPVLWDNLVHDPDGPAARDHKLRKWLLSLAAGGRGTPHSFQGDGEDLSVASRFSYTSSARSNVSATPTGTRSGTSTPTPVQVVTSTPRAAAAPPSSHAFASSGDVSVPMNESQRKTNGSGQTLRRGDLFRHGGGSQPAPTDVYANNNDDTPPVNGNEMNSTTDPPPISPMPSTDAEEENNNSRNPASKPISPLLGQVNRGSMDDEETTPNFPAGLGIPSWRKPAPPGATPGNPDDSLHLDEILNSPSVLVPGSTAGKTTDAIQADASAAVAAAQAAMESAQAALPGRSKAKVEQVDSASAPKPNNNKGGDDSPFNLSELKEYSRRRSRNSALIQERLRMSNSSMQGLEEMSDLAETGSTATLLSAEANNASVAGSNAVSAATNIIPPGIVTARPPVFPAKPVAQSALQAPEHMIIAIRLLKAHKRHVDAIMETLRIEMDALRDFDRLLEEPGRPTEDEVLDYFESVGLCLEQRTLSGVEMQEELDRVSRGEPPQEFSSEV